MYELDRPKKLDVSLFSPAQYARAWKEVGQLSLGWDPSLNWLYKWHDVGHLAPRALPSASGPRLQRLKDFFADPARAASLTEAHPGRMQRNLDGISALVDDETLQLSREELSELVQLDHLLEHMARGKKDSREIYKSKAKEEAEGEEGEEGEEDPCAECEEKLKAATLKIAKLEAMLSTTTAAEANGDALRDAVLLNAERQRVIIDLEKKLEENAVKLSKVAHVQPEEPTVLAALAEASEADRVAEENNKRAEAAERRADFAEKECARLQKELQDLRGTNIEPEMERTISYPTKLSSGVVEVYLKDVGGISDAELSVTQSLMTPDPYVVIQIVKNLADVNMNPRGKSSNVGVKSSMRKNTLTPVFNEAVMCPASSDGSHIAIQLWDFKRFGLHRLMGTATYQLTGNENGEEVLHLKLDPSSGHIYCSIRFIAAYAE